MTAKIFSLNPDDWTEEDTATQPDTGGRLAVTDHPGVPDGYVIPAPWVVTDDGIEKMQARGKLVVPLKVAHAPIFITERWIDDEGREALRLSWPRDGEWRGGVYERDEVLISQKVGRLAADGAPVGGSNLASIATYLLDIEAANLATIPVRRMTRSLGWLGGGTTEFVANLADSEVEFNGAPGTDKLAAAFRRSGTLAGWQEAAEVLRDHPRAALGIYAAIAAPLLRVVGVPPFTMDWAGETSRGKSTTVKVGASVWGSPDLVRSWDATPVAIEQLAGTLFGLPLILDETKRARSHDDVAEVLYAVSQGQGRHRGARNGGLRETVEWSTVVMSTGEQPITTFTSDAGTRGRVVSVWGSPFEARDPKLVRDLTRAVGSNYGHAGPLFVDGVLARRSEWESWQDNYDDIVDELSTYSENPVVQRRAALVAVLRMAAGLTEKFGILDWAPPRSFWASLLTTGAGAEDDDQARLALGQIYEWAVAHPDRFAVHGTGEGVRSSPGHPGHNGWAGRWDGDLTELVWMPNVLGSVLAQRGHEYESTVKVWKERGWLRTDSKGHATPMVRVDKGRSNRCIVIREEAVQWLAAAGSGAVPHSLEPGQYPPEDAGEV